MLSFGLIAAQIFRRLLNIFVLKRKTCKLILGEGSFFFLPTLHEPQRCVSELKTTAVTDIPRPPLTTGLLCDLAYICVRYCTYKHIKHVHIFSHRMIILPFTSLQMKSVFQFTLRFLADPDIAISSWSKDNIQVKKVPTTKRKESHD